MQESEQRLCRVCRKPMVQVSTEEPSAGEIYACHNHECPEGPGGLVTVRPVSADGGVTSRLKDWGDGRTSEHTQGPPSTNEGNVVPVARRFIADANRQYGTDYLPEPTVVHGLPHDCLVAGPDVGTAKLQITRIFDGGIYEKQRHLQHRNLDTTHVQMADRILAAIMHKSKHAHADIVLVLDGLDAMAAGFGADLIARERIKNETFADGWHSVWVVGHFGLRYLCGNPLPAPIGWQPGN